jgi:O-antigen ligase
MIISKTGIIIFIFFINSMVEITNEFVFSGLHSGLIRGGIVLLLVFYLIKDVKFDGAGAATVVFLLYIFVLITRNTNYLYALNQYTGVLISLFMLPICVCHFDLKQGLQKLRTYLFIVLYILIIHFFWAQLFNYGEDPYGLNIYLGGGGVYQVYTIVYILLFLPFIISVSGPEKIRWHELIALFLSVIPVLLIFRRAAVLSLICGFIIFIFFIKEKKSFIKYAFIALILIIPVIPGAFETVSQRLEARSLDIEEQQMSSRGGEIPVTINVISTSEMSRVLFGSEMFDYKTLSNTDRSLHVDYARLLIGSGIIGFVLYMAIFFRIWLSYFSFRKNIADIKFRSVLFAVMLALSVAFILFSYSSQLTQVSSLSTLMMFFGVLIKYIKEGTDKKIVL